jgi:hypothetical protein
MRFAIPNGTFSADRIDVRKSHCPEWIVSYHDIMAA